MHSSTIVLIIMAVIDIPLFIFIGKILFGSWSEFWDAIVFWFTPDIVSLLTGEYWEDMKAELKLGVFVILCGACIFGELWFFVKLYGDSGTV